jgi:Ca-activated chloride channel family protein
MEGGLVRPPSKSCSFSHPQKIDFRDRKHTIIKEVIFMKRKIMVMALLITFALSGCADSDTRSQTYNYTESSRNSSYNDAVSDEDTDCDDYYYEESKVTEVSPYEDYSHVEESGFKDPYTEPLSTFSADVDTASYSNVRRIIEDSQNVPEDAVRIEELINYFDYDYPQPSDGEVFSQYAELSDCPWNSRNKLLMIGIQGKEIDDSETPPSNLVFLIDSSGSMSSYNKLPLVQSAFSMLAEELTENDRISIVTYSGSSRVVIAGADGSKKDDILSAIYSITASGGTNGEGGIETAYELAEKYFIEGGNNRIILATDGDMNIGASTEDELVNLIENKCDKGIYLSVLGFGTGNIKDSNLEAIADNGNGNYSYIDSIKEAERVLSNEMKGTLYTIAKDVKIQVEFNPSQVKSYRLIGYDNRLMEAHDFVDSTKDAGEVGSGHSVTALYEIELADTDSQYDGIELEFASEHKTTEIDTDNSKRSEICKISTAYKDIDTDKDEYISTLCGKEIYSEKPSDSFKIASAVTEFGMLLKNSEYMGSSSYNGVSEILNTVESSDTKKDEFAELVKTASTLYK